MPSSTETVKKHIDAFHKAITAEMDAMRKRLGPFEIPVCEGRALDEDDLQRTYIYAFRVISPNDKLVLNTECTLRHDTGEYLVTIAGIEKDAVTLSCKQKIKLNRSSYTLVIYPWFLYEKLKYALTDLLTSNDVFLESALRTFGQLSPIRKADPPDLSHGDLNPGQKMAVELCCDSNLAFVWGPPGTGKTTTLGHIITELLNKGCRILVTSTTNAAVDQALAKLKSLPLAQMHFDRGEIVRLGQTSEDTHGAGLYEVLHQLNAETLKALRQLKKRLPELYRNIQHCDQLLKKLDTVRPASQLSLFETVQTVTLNDWDLAPVFSKQRIDRIITLPVQAQIKLISQRKLRLEKLRSLIDEKIQALSRNLTSKENDVVSNASLILATMTNVYISQLLTSQRFDVVIIEEAGMAILPTLFYCTTLAKEKVIIVGDPKQLPSIVQSRDPHVHQAMGRSIFEVRVPDPHLSDVVVMLNIQYRMHPVIGDMVSHLFYNGKLINDEGLSSRDEISNKAPYPGDPLVVIDTGGQTHCTTYQGSFSRINPQTAELCKDLALIAIKDKQESVAIITPYAEQSRLIRNLLTQAGIDSHRVVSRTVHRFQGNERDIVILDTVDTAPLKPGVLLSDTSVHSSSDNLINVSISRARGKLIVISDVSYFNARAPEGSIRRVLAQAIRTGTCIPWEERT